MKIIKKREAINSLALMMAVELYLMHFFVSPYQIEEKYNCSSLYITEESELTHKRTKKYNSHQPKTKRYTFEK